MVGEVDDVLQADRDAVQRAAGAVAGDLGFGGAGIRHRPIGDEADDGVEAGLHGRDAVEAGVQQLDRRQAAGGDEGGGLGEREGVGRGHAAPLGFTGAR